MLAHTHNTPPPPWWWWWCDQRTIVHRLGADWVRRSNIIRRQQTTAAAASMGPGAFRIVDSFNIVYQCTYIHISKHTRAIVRLRSHNNNRFFGCCCCCGREWPSDRLHIALTHQHVQRVLHPPTPDASRRL